jgi:hypothetical protein
MKKIKVASKSNPGTYRTVRIKEGIDGKNIYECSCPANVWYRLSGGNHGKKDCRHIALIKKRLND